MATAADSTVTMVRGGMPALGSKVQVIENEIDLATVSTELVAQGDGVLATDDVISVLTLPQGTVVLSAGFEITETVVGVAALPVALGVTGGDTNAFVAEVDIGAGTSYVLTDYVPVATTAPVVIGTGAGAASAAGVIALLCGTVSATSVTAGKLRVYAVLADANDLTG